MNTFSIICMFVIMACGVGIIADTLYDCVKYYKETYLDDEEES